MVLESRTHRFLVHKVLLRLYHRYRLLVLSGLIEDSLDWELSRVSLTPPHLAFTQFDQEFHLVTVVLPQEIGKLAALSVSLRLVSSNSSLRLTAWQT